MRFRPWAAKEMNFWGLVIGLLLAILKIVFSPIRLAYKGFLLDSKAIGGLDRGGAGLGSLKEPAPRVPWASRAWLVAPNSKVKNCFWHFQLLKNCLWRSELSKNAFGALDCQKMCLEFFIVKKSRATKSKAKQCKAIKIKATQSNAKQWKAKQCKAVQSNAKQSNAKHCEKWNRGEIEVKPKWHQRELAGNSKSNGKVI